MLELKLGFMSVEDLADWSQRSANTIKKDKKKWCEKNLSLYADYHYVYGGVEILSIKEPIFQGSGYKEVQQKYPKYWGTKGFPADTNINCWRKLKKNMTNPIKDSVGQAYISKARVEDYGIAIKNRKKEGRFGRCYYVFCKIINGEAYPFTPEEEKIKQELKEKHLKTDADVVFELKCLSLALENKEIKEKEYTERVKDITATKLGWDAFQEALEKAIHCETDCRVFLEGNAIKIYGIKKGKFEF